MGFLSSKHALKFRELIKEDNTHSKDSERQALFYIIGGNDDLFKKRHFIYNFKDNSINPECLTNGEVDFSTSSKALIRLGFNLYNNYKDDYISPMNIFYSLDENNYNLAVNAIDVRFGRDIEKEISIEDEIEEELEL
ncbi:hypothetical protein DW1_2107 [Proteiniborus sp. DW1]|uniref:DUF6075 family protein n=1 Tax=Proteiniborus sp. DW1 TaxID=1889883 RepID=UPI00092DF7AF|nr:DUF6075 family protein [Proteiniborus sp. DW1]SCG83673.1 hypothetical protein DW1_2107 [Proteiniborus sp. DW1]